jgi:hypothetical protein
VDLDVPHERSLTGPRADRYGLHVIDVIDVIDVLEPEWPESNTFREEQWQDTCQ